MNCSIEEAASTNAFHFPSPPSFQKVESGNKLLYHLICQRGARKPAVWDENKADGMVSPVPVVIIILLLADQTENRSYCKHAGWLFDVQMQKAGQEKQMLHLYVSCDQ